MLKTLHVIRQSAERVASAAEGTLGNLSAGRIRQEPAFTDRMLGRIEQAMDGYVVKGVQWEALTLPDRGPGSQEKIYGADFLGVIDIEIAGYRVKKGFLAQAKLIRPGAYVKKADFDFMIDQCKKMLRISPDSFIFLYAESGIRIVSALSVLSLTQPTNPHELYQRSTQRFFEEFFECFFGDQRLDRASIATLKQLGDAADEAEARNALLLKMRSVTTGN